MILFGLGELKLYINAIKDSGQWFTHVNLTHV